MATEVGIVKVIVGTVTATSADGSVRNLQAGDKVFADDLITTGLSGAVEIEFEDGSLMDLGRSSQVVLDNNVFDPNAITVVEEETGDALDPIQQALLDGEDPTLIGEATAAGAGVQNGNEGHEPVFVDYLAPEAIPDAGFETTGVSSSIPPLEEEEGLFISSNTPDIGEDNPVELNGLDFDGAEVVVNESNLGDGSSPNTSSLTQLGTFSFSAVDGLDTISIAGQSFPLSVLQALSSSPVTISTDYGELTLTNYSGDNLGGTISYSYTLNENVDNDSQAGATDEGYDESVDVIVTDQDGSQAADTLDIHIVDDAPVAIDDTDTTQDGVASGNVITDASAGDTGDSDDGEDTVGADGAVVTAVSSGDNEGEENDGVYSVEGEHGTLTIDADGNYTYTFTAESGDLDDITLTAFNLGESFLDDETGQFSSDEATGTVSSQANGYGVTGSSGQNQSATSQINYSGNESEALAFSFGDQTVTSATVQLSNMFQNESGGEAGRWHAFDSDGNVVASGIVSQNDDGPYESTTDVNWLNVHQAEFTISGIGEFSTLVFEAIPYSNDGSRSSDNSEYYVQVTGYEVVPDGGEYSDEFTYTITDEDGDTAEATLTITGNAITGEAESTIAPVAVGNEDSVNEDESTTGNVITDDNDGGGVASGVDWDQDTPLIDLSVSTINGTEVVDGTEITTEYGTLTINTDGSYTYVANGSSAQALGGDDTVFDTFEYTITDPNGNVSNTATLTIEVNGLNDLVGTAADDELIGTIERDSLRGEEGNDSLLAAEGDDILFGGAGDDEMTGGTGQDKFVWEAGDDGNAAFSVTANDTVTDFSADDGDTLDISDLLQGEEAGDLTNYLSVEESGSDVVISITPDGATDVTQIITLENTSLSDLGANATSTQADIINTLIDSGYIHVDS